MRRQYTAPFKNAKERNGAVGFAWALLHEQPWFGTLAQQLPPVRNHPVLLLWGMRDKFCPLAYLHRFTQAFHQAQAVEFQTCGHVPQEEEAAAVLQHLWWFLSERPM